MKGILVPKGPLIEPRVSIIVPVVDETDALRETIRILLEETREWIQQILIVTGRITTPAALEVCRELAAAHPDLVDVRSQRLPFLGGAVRDAFEWATGTHVVLMASDLETDPHTVKDLIAEARKGYDIVTTTRWKCKGAFEGYNPVKLVLNWVFQRFFSILYGTNLTDLTFGFRIYRTECLRGIRWKELRHPFLLESLVKPLRLGATVAEISTTWKARPEGESHNPFWRNFLYFGIGIQTRLADPSKLRTH